MNQKLLESSIKSIEEVTEIVGIENSSQNDIPGFNDLNKTQTMLELSLKNSQQSRHSSSNKKEGLELP